MKKFLSKILISVVTIAIFLAPVSGGLKNRIEKNVALAAGFVGSSVNLVQAKQTEATFLVTVRGSLEDWAKIDSVTDDGNGYVLMKPRSIQLRITTDSNDYVVSPDITTSGQAYAWTPNVGPIIENQTVVIKGLTAGQTYKAELTYRALAGGFREFGQIISFTTPNTGEAPVTTQNVKLKLGCSIFNGADGIVGCVAELTYGIFSLSSLVARLAGHFLDFFIYYSTNSSSYKNEFIQQGWEAVRDVANILFIIALLFVAVKTILGLNVSNNKKLVGSVIIIALVINFSLFTTKVVIDASNILAKVFYNNITSVKQGTDTLVVEKNGEKSLSIGLLDKFNPQGLVTQSVYNENQWTFIFMTLLLIVIILYTAYIFFAVALLFVSRVISLWIAMIFSPLAFISYALPFHLPAFGNKDWWDDLLKNAFLAPAFIFFLYIIILFTGFLGKVISYTDSPNLTGLANVMQHSMSVVIPFVIIFMLLNKAKALAVKMSGEMGKAVMSAGKMIGGAALGATAGMGAFAMKQSIGRLGANLAESQWLKDKAAKGKIGAATLRMTKGVGSGSFDIRGIKVGGKSLASTGMSNMKAKEGGFAKERANWVKKKEEFTKNSLNTTDYGTSKMIQGGMSDNKSLFYQKQMMAGGMSGEEANRYGTKLTEGGLTPTEAKEVANYLDSAKSKGFANRLGKGVFFGKTVFATNRMAANKIRKDADAIKKEKNTHNLINELSKLVHPPTVTTTTATATHTSGGGGASTGGGHTSAPTATGGGASTGGGHHGH